MSPPDHDTFLCDTRLGILTTMRAGGEPVSVPVWYEWSDERAWIFTNAASAKVRRLERDPRASLLVTNHIDEPERWVAIDGAVTIQRAGAIELAERLAQRYWRTMTPERAAELQRWRDHAGRLVVLQLVPSRIRSSLG